MMFSNRDKRNLGKQQYQDATNETATIYAPGRQIVPIPSSGFSYTTSDMSQENTNRLPVPIQMTLQAESIVDISTGKLPAVSENTLEPQRTPVVIRGSGKEKVALLPPSVRGKRVKMQITVAILLFFIVSGSLLFVLPAGTNGQSAGMSLFNSSMHISTSKNNNVGSVAAVAATATAVTVDGYDRTSSGATTTYAGVTNVTLSGATGDNFSAGQCTYWADYRYHQLTNNWVPWPGNAWQWYGGAINAGWMTSTQPTVPSIIVLAPYVQGAYGYGHVAVVEKINADGSVLTSNWNWLGNWGRTTYVTFYPGYGVHFVWKP